VGTVGVLSEGYVYDDDDDDDEMIDSTVICALDAHP
jgi:hypothetical protein